jgi:hypothetical protein
MGSDTNSIPDAIPAASLVVGTWLVFEFTHDSFANTEAYTMLEAAGFSSITGQFVSLAADHGGICHRYGVRWHG